MKSIVHTATFILVLMMTACGTSYSQNYYWWPSAGYGEPSGNVLDIVSFQGNLLALAPSGVYASHDNGGSWTQQGLPANHDYSVRFSVLDGNRIFYSTYGGTFTSTDNGASWVQYGAFSPEILAATPGYVFGIGSTNSLFRSVDDGDTWTELSQEQFRSITTSSTALLLATPNKVNYSSDNGTTFSTVLNGTGNGVVQASGQTVYAGKASTGLWRSDNGGLTWSDVPSFTSSVSQITFATGVIFIASGNKIFRSTDNGVMWQQNTGNLGDIQVTRIAEHNGAYFASTNHNGILRSIDGGATWNRYGSGMFHPKINAAIGDGSTMIVGGADGIFRSESGNTWEEATTDLSGVSIASFAADGTNYLAASDGGGVYLSSDDGETWTQSNTGLTNLSVRDFAVTSTKIYATTPSGLFVSTDHGASWSPTTATFAATYVDVSQAGVIYVASEEPRLYVSSNGATFNVVTGLPPEFGGINGTVTGIVHSATKVYVGTYKGVYVASGGSTVTALNPEFTGVVYSIAAEGDNIYVGSEYDVFQISPVMAQSLYYYSPHATLFMHAGKLYATALGAFSSGEVLGGLFKRSVSDFPVITGFSPTSAKVGDLLTITGDHLGSLPNDVHVQFGIENILGTIIQSDAHSLVVSIPPTAGDVSIELTSQKFFVETTKKLSIIPELKSFNNLKGFAWSTITASATGFPSNAQFIGKVGDTDMGVYVSGYSGNEISFTIPDYMVTGNISILYKGVQMVPPNTKLVVLPTITSLNSTIGSVGESLVIFGSGFSNGSEVLEVKIGGVSVPVTNSNGNYIGVTLTPDVKSGRVTVSKAGHTAISAQTFILATNEPNCLVIPDKPVITTSNVSNSIVLLTSSSNGGNQWYHNGQFIEGESGGMLYTAVSGVFTVRVDVDGCKSPMSDPLTVVITGLEVDDGELPGIYPNPFDSKLVIDLSGHTTGSPVEIKLHNGYGAVVLESTETGENASELNTSHLPGGLYLLTIGFGDKTIARKVVKR